MRLRKIRRVLPPDVRKAVSGMPGAMKDSLTAAVRKGATATVTRRDGTKTEVKMDGRTFRVLVGIDGDKAYVALYPGKGASAKADETYDRDAAAHTGATTYIAEGDSSFGPTVQMVKDAVGARQVDCFVWCGARGGCAAVGADLFQSMTARDVAAMFGDGEKAAPAQGPAPAAEPPKGGPAPKPPIGVVEAQSAIRVARGLVEDLTTCRYGISISTLAKRALDELDYIDGRLAGAGEPRK